MPSSSYYKNTSGFTLLELAVVLVIIALITSMAMTSGVAVITSARVAATQSKMTLIEQALMSYRSANNRLPCPASLTIAEGATNFGVEAATPGTCTGGTPAANFSGAGATNAGQTGVEGTVPVATLGLANDYMYDGWGHRIRYAVDRGLTATGAFNTVVSSCTNRAITVKDATSGNIRSTGAIYALISHGETGHGAYNKNGTITNAGSTNTDEQTNCHCSSTAASTTYAPTYIQKDPATNPATLTDRFDDIATYKERWQLQVAWDKPGNCNFYIWVSDPGNHRVQKFDSNGNYITSAGTGYNGSAGTMNTCGGSGSNGRICSPSGLTSDSSGNIYVSTYDTTYGNIGIVKFNSSGVWVSDIVGMNNENTANGRFYGVPNGLAMDASGNIWAGDAGNNRVQKFSNSGAWSLSVGGGALPHTCTTSPSGSQPACPGGIANGQFYPTTSIQGIAFDSSSNLWVIDQNSQRIQKFDSSGNYISQVPCASGPCSSTVLATPWGVAIDSAGNVWSSDGTNNRIMEFNPSTGAVIFQFPCASGKCTGGTTNGVFADTSGADMLTFDPDGNIWAADYQNNRVQKFSPSGTYLMQLGCGGTGSCATSSSNGYFNNVESITITKQ